ncbi:hypothetical protein [Haloglycomyces albus]|uniref:hypothetical protein n=1 Tax=Haloglycomyces albus TaxID=526067 RepID=UPI00046D8BAF|nr:hypothetical protein [Haloglycomyces albus]
MSLGYTLTTNTLNGTTSAGFTGAEERTISDSDQSQLGLTTEALKDAIKKIRNYRPSSAYLHSPAPTQYVGDMYRDYGWGQAALRLRPIEVKFDDPKDAVDKQLAIVEHLVNTSSASGTYHVNATTEYTDTISNSWSNTNTVKWDLSIKAELKILGSGGGVATTIGYQHDWMHNKTESFSYKLGVNAGVDVKLEPGQAVDVLIYGKVAQYCATVTYAVEPAGGLCAYCWGKDDWHDKHHDWNRDFGEVAGYITRFPQTVTETVRFGFASDGTIKLVDGTSGTKLAERSLNDGTAFDEPFVVDLTTN